MDISARGRQSLRAAGSRILRPSSPASTWRTQALSLGRGSPCFRIGCTWRSRWRIGHCRSRLAACSSIGELLDLRQGVLWREWRQQDPSGRITRLSYLQLASLADRHVLLQSVAVTAENYAGRISLITGLAPSDVTRTDTALIAAEPTAMLMRVSGTEVAIASASELRGPAGSRTASHEGGPQGGEERWSWEASLGETARPIIHSSRRQ